MYRHCRVLHKPDTLRLVVKHLAGLARSAADIETLTNIGNVDLQAARPDLLF